ncbi:MAG TPA: FtsW/RodA/SpoVE family cell cycle protein [Acidimicrobiia bacterium]
MISVVTAGRKRRNTELGLGFLAVVVTIGGYILLALANGPTLPPDLGALLAGIVGLYVIAHLAVRRLAPHADGTLLPLAAVLNGIGFVTITRLDRNLARIQSIWSAVGVAAFVLTLLAVRRVRTLERYTYTFALAALGLLLVPLVPHLGLTVNGARIWAHLGPLHFQPGEPAKVLWVAFFAGYLTQKRELLSAGSRSIGRLRLPAARHLGPLLVTWGVSILVLVFERDLGSSLLFFAVFASMLYMATERSAYLLGSLALFSAGAVTAYHLFGHVRDRVQGWLNPWPYRTGPKGYQIIQSWYAFAAGGVYGKGIGLGIPDRIPYASTDFIFAAIGEELGLIGTLAIVACFLLLVGSGYRIAVESPRPFSKLFAAGLTTILGLQTFIIIGGVTRMIPLTGITLPFVSYGGSSLVANFVILALLLRMSDECVTDEPAR